MRDLVERDGLVAALRMLLIEHTQGFTRTTPDYELMGELFIEGFVQLGPLADDLLTGLDFEKLADEAERGYDVTAIRERRRPQ